MSETVANIDRLLASTSHALHGARALAWRSPNAERLHLMEVLEERVDYLLDKRLRAMQQEAVAEALVT